MEKERILWIAGIVFVVLMLFFGWCYTKKSERTEKIGWLVIGLLAAAFVVFTIWYHIPIRCWDHVQVVETNEQKECVIELELFIRRSYLRGTEVSGWICTPQDTYGSSWVGEATRKNGRYYCNTMFRADTMAWEPSFDDCIYHLCVEFSRGFDSVTDLELIERRQSDDETYWYTTPATP